MSARQKPVALPRHARGSPRTTRNLPSKTPSPGKSMNPKPQSLTPFSVFRWRKSECSYPAPCQSRPGAGRSWRISRCQATGSTTSRNGFNSRSRANAAIRCRTISGVARTVSPDSSATARVAVTFTFPPENAVGSGKCSVPSACGSRIAVMVLMARHDTGIGLHVKPHLCVRPSRTRPRATGHRCSGLTRWANFLPLNGKRG